VIGATAAWWGKPALIGTAALVVAAAFGAQAWHISMLKRDNLLLQGAEKSASQAAAAWKHPADAASGPPAGDAGVVFADVLARLERRGGELARLAGERGAAGSFCERERDSLTTMP